MTVTALRPAQSFGVNVHLPVPRVAIDGAADDCVGAQLHRGETVVLAAADGRSLLVAAAHCVTTSAFAFLVRHTSGFVEVALPASRCAELNLPPLDPFGPAGSRMCVGVDAIEGTTTGISAADRATTARTLLSADAVVDSFTRPGHLIPVSVETHALYTPRSAASSALQLVISAGLPPGAVFAELIGVADPTTMMGARECIEFADVHELPLITETSESPRAL